MFHNTTAVRRKISLRSIRRCLAVAIIATSAVPLAPSIASAQFRPRPIGTPITPITPSPSCFLEASIGFGITDLPKPGQLLPWSRYAAFSGQAVVNGGTTFGATAVPATYDSVNGLWNFGFSGTVTLPINQRVLPLNLASVRLKLWGVSLNGHETLFDDTITVAVDTTQIATMAAPLPAYPATHAFVKVIPVRTWCVPPTRISF